MTQLAIANAAPWTRVVFTTYALSLTFFETVVMDALVRGGARDILIFSDVEGVRGSLSEKGVRGVGRDYRLEPVALTNRNAVFHPKIGAFVGDTDALITVGSGNLTFGGWANNLEMIEVLHPAFAASAFGDVAEIFELLAIDDRVRHEAGESCEETAADLRRSARGQRDRGDLRVLHGFGRSIGTQLQDMASDLGGATRLAVASPYFDDGTGLSSLARSLGLEEVLVHRHDHVAPGTAPNWPHNGSARVRPAALEIFAEDIRPLHAKAFEITCRKGRLIVSGSANATERALGDGGNIEAVTVRTVKRGASWGWTPVDAPPRADRMANSEKNALEAVGILRAQLDGSLLTGQVLTPAMSGPARLEQVTSMRSDDLGPVVIGPAGEFRLEAPGLELQAWNAGRLVLRVSNGQGAAEGYASSAAATTIGRRLGVMAQRLFAFLAGSDTPDDVAALFDWISHDPARLPSLMSPQADRGGRESGHEETFVQADDLVWTPALSGPGGKEAREARIMMRLVDQLRSALRGTKAPFEPPVTDSDDQSDDGANPADLRRRQQRHDAALARSETLTAEFLDWALDSARVGVWGVLALELLNHMAQRLNWPADQTLNWLERIAAALTPESVTAEDASLVAGSVLALSVRLRPEVIRAHLIRLQFSIDGEAPDPSEAPLFTLTGAVGIGQIWEEIRRVRSVEEVVAEFVRAIRNPSDTSPEALSASPLKAWCPDEWPLLLASLTDERARRQILFGRRRQSACPKCSMMLPTAQADNYRTRLVATAKNCGHGVLIFGGDPA